jgi:hypothetical protein
MDPIYMTGGQRTNLATENGDKIDDTRPQSAI